MTEARTGGTPMRKDERGRIITTTTIRETLTAEEWRWTQNLIKNYGDQWLIDNWLMLEDQLEYIRSL
jgi:hypothetical protein